MQVMLLNFDAVPELTWRRQHPDVAVHSAHRVINDSMAVAPCKCLSLKLQRTSRYISITNPTPRAPLTPMRLQAIVLGCVTTDACQHMSA